LSICLFISFFVPFFQLAERYGSSQPHQTSVCDFYTAQKPNI